MSFKLSPEEVLQRYNTTQNKNLLKMCMMKKILQKHDLPDTCPVKDIVTVIQKPQEGIFTIQHIRPVHEGGGDKNVTHINVQKKKNKLVFQVTD